MHHTRGSSQRFWALTTLVFVALLSPFASAQVTTWDGSTDGSWSDATNGDSDPALPANGDDLIFDANAANSQFSITLGANRTARGLTFAATGSNGFTCATGNQLTLSAGGITNSNSFTQTFDADGRINSNQSWAATSGNLDFSNVLINRNLVLTGSNDIDFGGTLTV
jgi:hypothetical protein